MVHKLFANNILKKLLFITGLLLIAQNASALAVPSAPDAISPYAQEVIQSMDNMLTNASSGSAGNCDGNFNTAKATRELREILFDTYASVSEPNADIERSACLVNDVEALEIYLRELIDLMIQSASSCDDSAKAAYQNAIRFVWNKLFDIRRFGTDPRTHSPFEGEVIDDPPSGSSSSDDDTRCPYHSVYTLPTISDIGCQDDDLPLSARDRLQVEMSVMNNILEKIGILGIRGLSFEFGNLRNRIFSIFSDRDDYISDVSTSRLPGPRALPQIPAFTNTNVDNSGESGCIGWPSDVVSGPVTGDDIPLQGYYPFVLTQEIAEVFSFLQERDHVRWFEYVRSLNTEIIDEELFLSAFNSSSMENINREHLKVESLSMLSIRDPQKNMQNFADELHKNTLDFASHVVSLDGGENADAPLRALARKYATFLSRMCVNRSCSYSLLRAIEHTLRDDCFSAFLMDSFFRDNPSNSTLPECRAIYAN
jgi:hypothetical protein